MAVKKSVKKSVEKPKKSEPKKVEAKKSKKAEPEEREVRRSPRRGTVGSMIPKSELSKAALKLIAEADKFEEAYLTDLDKHRETLDKLRDELGGFTFEHPSRGPMSIMQRGYTYWRTKPGRSTEKASKKTTKKKEK